MARYNINLHYILKEKDKIQNKPFVGLKKQKADESEYGLFARKIGFREFF